MDNIYVSKLITKLTNMTAIAISFGISYLIGLIEITTELVSG